MENQTDVVKEIKRSSFFIVGALCPSFLISFICVLLYLFSLFPELREPVSEYISSLLQRVKQNNAATQGGTDQSGSKEGK